MEKSFKIVVVKSLFWKYGERVIAQIVSLIVAIILARLLSPSEYGAVSLAMVFITLANVFVSNGLGTSLVQKEKPDSLDFSSIFYVNIFMSFIIYLVVYCLAPFVAKFYNIDIICPVLRVLGLRVILASINSIQHAYVSKKMLFFNFFLATLIGTILSGIIGIFLAYNGYGVWALVVQYLSNSFIDTVVLFFAIDWKPKFEFSYLRAKVLFCFGWKLFVSGFINTLYQQLRNLLVGKYYSLEDLSYYNQGEKYPSIIVGNVNVSISSVIFPAISNYQSDIYAVKQITRRFIQISSYIIWPIMIGFLVCSEHIVILLLTTKWLPIVPYLRIFCFVYGLYPIHSANLQSILAVGRSDIFLKLEIIKKIIGIIILILTIKTNPFIIALFSIPESIISICINASPNAKLFSYTFREQLNDLLQSFIISIIMGVIVYSINYINFSSFVILVVQIIVGVFSYIVLSIITRNESYYYLLGFIGLKK